ncbi:MAG: oxalate---CoA ligase, partial [Alphaproteobacteria bacterium]|nr:oxalate---CoA ligase [Alphaproteobacteria bacterium]
MTNVSDDEPHVHFASGASASYSTLPHLLEHQAGRIPDAPAILAPGRAPLSYGRLYRHIDGMGRTLRTMGVGRHDRVAVVLPNGPELAVAILTVSASAVCVPMNPAYGREELDRYFSDLRPCVLLTAAGFESPARQVAVSGGIRLIELLTEENAEAGLFTFTENQGVTPSDERASPGDVALLARTSGTTSQPKIVLVPHAKVCSAAYSWSAALALTETDRCLNVMPLFHGHGLTATLLASLTAGASVVCTPGLDINSFFAWLTTFRPTWYTAVPTLHQAILAAARHHRGQVAESRLRFIRSASAPLPPRVFEDLERTFETCVINGYAMTETAAGPLACNPLPPLRRKAGSVGVPVDLDLAIMDEAGALLPDCETGEVVVRGASVMSGYDDDPSANQTAFAGG